MAGITLAQAKTKLTLWMDADDALATSQSYSTPGPGGERMTLTRADAKLVKDNIIFWQKMVQDLSGSGMKVRGITPAINP